MLIAYEQGYYQDAQKQAVLESIGNAQNLCWGKLIALALLNGYEDMLQAIGEWVPLQVTSYRKLLG